MLDPWRALHPAIERGRIGIRPRDQRIETADPFGPIEREQPVFDAQHRGRVDRLAAKDTVDELAAFCQAEKISGRGRGAGSRSSRSTARGLSTSMPCAASPPSAFCQLNVPTSILRQSMCCAKAADGGVANGKSGAVGRDPVGAGTRTPLVVPFQVKTMSLAGSMPQVADLPIVGRANVGIELQLLGDVGHPAGAEAFPRQHGHRAAAEQRPYRHLHGAGVRCGDDAQLIVGREAEHRMRPLDRRLQFRLADGATVRSPECGCVERSGQPAGRLRAGSR